jgi:hypothetical protein
MVVQHVPGAVGQLVAVRVADGDAFGLDHELGHEVTAHGVPEASSLGSAFVGWSLVSLVIEAVELPVEFHDPAGVGMVAIPLQPVGKRSPCMGIAQDQVVTEGSLIQPGHASVTNFLEKVA